VYRVHVGRLGLGSRVFYGIGSSLASFGALVVEACERRSADIGNDGFDCGAPLVRAVCEQSFFPP
jgi:hypothetical protein